MGTPGLAIGMVLAGALAAHAQTTYYVNGTCGDNAWTGTSPVCAAPDGPKRTIQAGLTASADDDTVIVADGVYSGPGNIGMFFGFKRVVLRSENGPEGCIIDQLNTYRAFFMADDLTPDTVIEGFTIRNGAGNPGGAFWFHHQNNPTIRNCLIINNSSTQGGAIHTETDAAPTFINCTIAGNSAVRGGAFSIAEISRPTIINCNIANNTATDEGGALYVTSFLSPGAAIINSTITGNTAANRAGALRLISGSVSARNSVVWNNTAPAGAQFAVGVTGGSPATLTVGHSIVQGGQAGVLLQGPGVLNWQAGNLDADPMFASPGAGNYRLLPDSPAIDAADNTAVPPGVLTDRDGNPRFVDDPATPNTGVPGGAGGNAIVDMGAYEFQGDSCYPDCNDDGQLTVADFGCFQTRFVLGDPYADCNADGALTVADFGCFQTKFVFGCP